MPSARFRFHGDLARFLRARGGAEVTASFADRAALKDTIEALGVPHPEVGEVRAAGAVVSLDGAVADGALVEVSPLVRPPPTEPPRFVLDGHLGRLAATLRMLGFDTWWRSDADDAALAQVSHDERRILLTRDVGLLKRSLVTDGSFVRATLPTAQAQEVIARFHLARHARPFSRCMRCNGLLEPVSRAEVEHRLPPRVRERQQAFMRCASCGHLYWAGTHHAEMERKVARLLMNAG